MYNGYLPWRRWWWLYSDSGCERVTSCPVLVKPFKGVIVLKAEPADVWTIPFTIAATGSCNSTLLWSICILSWIIRSKWYSSLRREACLEVGKKLNVSVQFKKRLIEGFLAWVLFQTVHKTFVLVAYLWQDRAVLKVVVEGKMFTTSHLTLECYVRAISEAKSERSMSNHFKELTINSVRIPL